MLLQPGFVVVSPISSFARMRAERARSAPAGNSSVAAELCFGVLGLGLCLGADVLEFGLMRFSSEHLGHPEEL